MAGPQSEFDARRSPDSTSGAGDWYRADSNKPPLERVEPTFPTSFPGYEVLSEISRSSSTRIFRAKSTGNNGVLMLSVRRFGADSTSAARQTQLAQMTAIGALGHPYLLTILEARELNNALVIVADFADAGTLEHWVPRNPLSTHQSAVLMEQVARGLQCAHEHGYTHGNLTPSCIWLQTLAAVSNRSAMHTALLAVMPKISDFGGAPPTPAPAYCAPERLAAADTPAPPADVYSAGAILYELLTGRPPFGGPSAVEVQQLIPSLPPVPPRFLRPSIPVALETICLKCLEKDPQSRYASAADLAADLRSFLDDRPLRTQPRRQWHHSSPDRPWRVPLVAAMVLAVALGAVSLWQFLQTRHERRQAVARLVEQRAAGEQQQRRDREKAQRLMRTLLADASAAEPQLLPLIIAAAAPVDVQADVAERIRLQNYQQLAFQPRIGFQAMSESGVRIRSWAMHPSKHWLLVTTASGVHLWDLTNGTEQPLGGSARPLAPTRCACWSNDGALLATGGENSVKVLRFPDRALLANIVVPGSVTALAFDVSATNLAIGAQEVGVWQLAQSRWLRPSWPALAPPVHLEFSPRGDRLLAAFHSGPARVYPFAPSAATVDIPWSGFETSTEHRLPLVPHFVRDGTALTTLNATGQVLIVDADSGKVMSSIPQRAGPNERMTSFGRDARGTRLIAVGRGESFQAAVGNLQWQPLPAPQDVVSCGFLSDSQEPWYGVRAGALIPIGAKALRLLPHHRPVLAVESIDPQRFATLQDDGLVRIWSTPTDPFAAPIRILPTPAAVHVLTGNDADLFVPVSTPAGDEEQRVAAFYSLRTGKPSGPEVRPNGLITATAVAPQQPLIALGVLRAKDQIERQQLRFTEKSDSAAIEVWKQHDGMRAWHYSLAAEPHWIEFSPLGDALAVITASADTYVFETMTGKLRWHQRPQPAVPVQPDPDRRGRVCFSPDGNMIFAWGLDQRLIAWQVLTGTWRYSMEPGAGRFLRVAFSPDNLHIAATHESQPVSLWRFDMDRPEVSRVTIPDSAGARAVGFAAGGRRLLLSGPDGISNLWDVKTGRLIPPGMRQTGTVFESFFIPDSAWLATVSNRSVRLWDIRDGLPLGPELVAPCRLVSARLTSKLELLLGSDDSRVFRIALVDWLTATTGNWSDLQLTAELTASHCLGEHGIITPLATSAWLERWRQLERAKANDAR